MAKFCPMCGFDCFEEKCAWFFKEPKSDDFGECSIWQLAGYANEFRHSFQTAFETEYDSITGIPMGNSIQEKLDMIDDQITRIAEEV